MLRHRIISGIVFILLLCQSAWALESSAPQFMSIADIHFNPFASCKNLAVKPCPIAEKLRVAPTSAWLSIFENDTNKTIDSYGHDTNYPLLKSSLAAIKHFNETQQPQFALVLGDFLAHNFRGQYILYTHDRSMEGYQSFVKKTLQFLTTQIRAALPRGDVYAAVGNNDSYTGDYGVVPNGAFFHDTNATWSMLIKDPNNQRSFKNSFAAGGYYAVSVPKHSQQKIIVLNSVLFTNAARGKAVKAGATMELSWLHTQLQDAQAKQQKVLIALHVPVSLSIYKTLMTLFGGSDEFWQHEYSEAFNKMLQEFAGTVQAVLPGHIHMDGLQTIKLTGARDIPVSFTPAISPIFGSNPGFKIYQYAPSLQLESYDVYYYPLDKTASQQFWQKEYSIDQVSNKTRPSPAPTAALNKTLFQ